VIPEEAVSVACKRNHFPGWRCVREVHADGPCALVPKWWNLADKWRYGKARK